jgi:hypothetical protein
MMLEYAEYYGAAGGFIMAGVLGASAIVAAVEKIFGLNPPRV